MNTPLNATYTPAITANITALAQLLTRAAEVANEAAQAAEAGERNNAIGTIAQLDDLIAAAGALHGAALTLHRQ